MRLSTRPREQPEVNLTSLIDVVFLLLIFFMISTSFVKESEIAIKLPTAGSATPPSAPAKIVELTITAGGSYLVNGRELVNNRPETLERALRQVSEGDTSLPINLIADADARHQDVITAMDTAGRMGFAQVNIATVKKKDE